MTVMELSPVLERKDDSSTLCPNDLNGQGHCENKEVTDVSYLNVGDRPNLSQTVEFQNKQFNSSLQVKDNLQHEEQGNEDYCHIKQPNLIDVPSQYESIELATIPANNNNSLENEISTLSTVQPMRIDSDSLNNEEPHLKRTRRKNNKWTNESAGQSEVFKSSPPKHKRKSFAKEEELNLVELRKPLAQGYVREVVYRQISISTSCDIYYRPPQGPKLRSKNDVVKFLQKMSAPFNLENFCFNRIPLGFGEPFEVVRNANFNCGRTAPNSSNYQHETKFKEPKLGSPKKANCITNHAGAPTKAIAKKDISKILNKIRLALNKDDNNYHIIKNKGNKKSTSLSGKTASKKRRLSYSENLKSTVVIVQEELDECVSQVDTDNKSKQDDPEKNKFSNEISSSKKRKLLKNDSNNSDATTKNNKLPSETLKIKKFISDNVSKCRKLPNESYLGKGKKPSMEHNNLTTVIIEKDHKKISFSRHSKHLFKFKGISPHKAKLKYIKNTKEICPKAPVLIKSNNSSGSSSNLEIKRPLAPALQHFYDVMDDVRAKNPTLKNFEISRIIDCMWRNICYEKKKKYEDDYVHLMYTYKASMKNVNQANLVSTSNSKLSELITSANDAGKDGKIIENLSLGKSSIPVFQMSVDDYSEIGINLDVINEKTQEKPNIENYEAPISKCGETEVPITSNVSKFPETARIRVRPLEELFSKPSEEKFPAVASCNNNLNFVWQSQNLVISNSSEIVKSSPIILFAPNSNFQNATTISSACQTPVWSLSTSETTASNQVQKQLDQNKTSNIEKTQSTTCILLNNSKTNQNQQCLTYVNTSPSSNQSLQNSSFGSLSYSAHDILRYIRFQPAISTSPTANSSSLVNKDFFSQTSINDSVDNNKSNSINILIPNKLSNYTYNLQKTSDLQPANNCLVSNQIFEPRCSTISSVIQTNSNSQSKQTAVAVTVASSGVIEMPVSISTFPSSSPSVPAQSTNLSTRWSVVDNNKNNSIDNLSPNKLCNYTSYNLQNTSDLQLVNNCLVNNQIFEPSCSTISSVIQTNSNSQTNGIAVDVTVASSGVKEMPVSSSNFSSTPSSVPSQSTNISIRRSVSLINTQHFPLEVPCNTPYQNQGIVSADQQKTCVSNKPLLQQQALNPLASPPLPLVIPVSENSTLQTIGYKNKPLSQELKLTPQQPDYIPKSVNNNILSSSQTQLKCLPNASKLTLSKEVTKKTVMLGKKGTANKYVNPRHRKANISSSALKSLNSKKANNNCQFSYFSTMKSEISKNKLKNVQNSTIKQDSVQNFAATPSIIIDTSKKASEKLTKYSPLITKSPLDKTSVTVSESSAKTTPESILISSSSKISPIDTTTTSKKYRSDEKALDEQTGEISSVFSSFGTEFQTISPSCDNLEKQLGWPLKNLQPYPEEFLSEGFIPTIFSDSNQPENFCVNSKKKKKRVFPVPNNFEIEEDRSFSPPLGFISEVYSLKDKSYDNVFCEEELTAVNANPFDMSQLSLSASAVDDSALTFKSQAMSLLPVNTRTISDRFPKQYSTSVCLPSWNGTLNANCVEDNKFQNTDQGNVFLLNLSFSNLKGYEKIFSPLNFYAAVKIIDSETGQLLAVRTTRKDGEQIYLKATGTVLFTGAVLKEQIIETKIINFALTTLPPATIHHRIPAATSLQSSSSSSFSSPLLKTCLTGTRLHSQQLLYNYPNFENIKLPDSINAIETPYS